MVRMVLHIIIMPQLNNIIGAFVAVFAPVIRFLRCLSSAPLVGSQYVLLVVGGLIGVSAGR